MTEAGKHESLHLDGFTVFADTRFEFVSGVNVLVGANGTGKTHVMKVLYALQRACSRPPHELGQVLKGVFQVERYRDLIRERFRRARAEGTWNGKEWAYTIGGQERKETLDVDGELPKMSRPVFLPAMDMMAHTRRFLSTYDEHQIDFDLTQRDIVGLLLSPERRTATANGSAPILSFLSEALGGTVEERDERFYLRNEFGTFPMPMVAEGLRKIATLHELVRNGWLEPGGVLFWDEPEVNLNPRLMDEVVEVVLTLARSGVQVFLATHSYVILKELDLQAKVDDAIRFFGFDTLAGATVVRPADEYAMLEPNPIAEQFDRLYDLELTRATGRSRT